MEASFRLSVPRPLHLRRTSKSNRFSACSRHNYSAYRALALKKIWNLKLERSIDLKEGCMNYALLIRMLGRNKLPHVARRLVLERKSKDMLDSSTLSALMLCYAENGIFTHARAIWDEILSSSFVPDIQVVSELINAYGTMGNFDEIIKIVHQISSKDFNFLPEIYSLAISCLGQRGQLEMMEKLLKEMVSRGFSVDSETGNAFIVYYSNFGSLAEMKAAYGRLKRSRILIEEEGIRAMSFAYMRESKFYKLGEFLRDVGLGRKNVGNLLWNLLLLSYAANFKMKGLQREFLRMVDAGFHPDLTTFNIRALAFSKMSLFWDLHLSLEHMNYERVVPDLVTYGSVVDAYVDQRRAKNLDFVLKKMNVDDSPLILTDPFVFEVMGKGDFHLSSETFLEFNRQRRWTYRELIATYLKKQYRSNQIFWNY